MKQRQLKVYEAPGQLIDVPRINLQGKWLTNLGYHIGDRIIVSCDDHGRLIIEPAPTDSEPTS